jgi:hypothetical protein
MYRTAYRTVDVNGLSVFYREAGPQDAPNRLPAAEHSVMHGKLRRRSAPDYRT